jgi:hypothetical protein
LCLQVEKTLKIRNKMSTPVPVSSGVHMFVRASVRAVWIISNIFYAIPTFVFWMFLLYPLSVLLPQVYKKIEKIGYSWMSCQVALWCWTAGYTGGCYRVHMICKCRILFRFSLTSYNMHQISSLPMMANRWLARDPLNYWFVRYSQ